MEDKVITENFITTKDNPFDPFTQFKSWYSYDHDLGYNTCELIDRIYSSLVVDDTNFDDETKESFLNESMKRIIEFQPEIYHMITNDTKLEFIPMDGHTVDESLFK